ncbi:MAG: flagellar M-ring protein FliF [Polyangiaceae bacterium]|nr:flagellar M-ring protein FliF [Polyangiaceae bacterium]
MSRNFQDFFASSRQFWASLSTPKRLALVLLSTLALAGTLIFPRLASQERMVPLYRQMEPEDAAEVVEKLKTSKTPYELSAGGTTVLVPEESLYALRLEMAKEGLPHGGSVGFELFDKNQFGATEFEQHVNLRRALEGELSRSISTVAGVSKARVHLVLPRQSVFISKREKASASIVVQLRNPGVFGKKEIAAVVHLVSAAVPGLQRNNISVVSTEGLTLHRPHTDDDPGYSGEALTEEAQALGAILEQRALAQLEKVVGPGGADVRVSVELDPSTRESTKEVYEPERTALRSEQVTTESQRSKTLGSAGIPGAVSNLPDAGGEAPTRDSNPGPSENSNRSSTTRNWEVDRQTERVLTPAGTVARLSVAVLLNGTWTNDDAGDAVYAPRKESELDQLGALVRQAVGFNELRGDSISISTAQFARPEVREIDAVLPPKQPWWRHPGVALGVLAAVLLTLLSVVILVWRSGRKNSLKELAAKRRTQEVAEMSSSPGATGAVSLSEPEEELKSLSEPSPNNGAAAIANMRTKALELAAHDPASTSIILRSWLEEGVHPTSAPREVQ